MLWRRRGLAALLGHRLRRVALPLALGLVTIVPAVNWAVEWAVDNGVADYVEQNNDIWAAAFFGNTEAVEVLLDRGFDVNAGNEADTALHLAAFTNDVAMVELLIERGADPAVASTDGTPMDYAVFLGNREAAEALVAAGEVDPRADGAYWEDVSIWAEGEALAIDKETVLGLDSWLLVSIVQVIYTWIMIVGLMGLFRYLIAKERRGVRYLSDSAYWLYLARLPLVIIAQSLIRNGDLPPGVKFLGLTLGLTALLLDSYQLLVRYTPIETLLNGKRTR